MQSRLRQQVKGFQQKEKLFFQEQCRISQLLQGESLEDLSKLSSVKFL